MVSVRELEYQLVKKIPVLMDCDVCVIGAGPGGMAAAVAAARNGCTVALIERTGAAGGAAQTAEVTPFMANHVNGKSLDHGIYHEWRKRMAVYAATEFDPAASLYPSRRFDRGTALLAAEDLCLENGVKIFYRHTLTDVRMSERGIEAVILHSKSGYAAVTARIFIDSTGDGDLAALAGCGYDCGNGDGKCQPMTLCFKLAGCCLERLPEYEEITRLMQDAKGRGELDCPRENVLFFPMDEPDVLHLNTTRVIGRSAVNGQELSESEIEGRRQLRQLIRFLRERVPGFENSYLLSIAPEIGVRESRRIHGLAKLVQADFESCRHFPDAIARVNYPIDIHNPDGGGTVIRDLPPGKYYEIPYGCIVAGDCANLLIGGRSISVDHAIHSSMRIMPVVCSIGEAAGMAAALCVEKNIGPAAVDGRDINRKLWKD